MNGAKQWVLLQLGVRKFREAWLRDYHTVVRMRTDMLYLDGFKVAEVAPLPETMHMISDNYFYATARHFVAVCDGIYDRFVDAVSRVASQLKTGPALDDATVDCGAVT